MKLFYCVLIALTSMTTVVMAADLEICGTCTYTTITDGITAANAGDRLLLTDSNYSENNLVIDKNLTIIGNGSDNTTIDGNWSNNMFHILSGVTVIMEDLNSSLMRTTSVPLSIQNVL